MPYLAARSSSSASSVETWPVATFLPTIRGHLTRDRDTLFENTTAAIEHLAGESRRLFFVQLQLEAEARDVDPQNPLYGAGTISFSHDPLLAARYQAWTRDRMQLRQSWHTFMARHKAQCKSLASTGVDLSDRPGVATRMAMLQKIREEHAQLFGTEGSGTVSNGSSTAERGGCGR